MNGFAIEYVELPGGQSPAREFIDSLDDQAAARIDAFIERLRTSGNRMEGIREEAHGSRLRASRETVRPHLSRAVLLSAGAADRDHLRLSKEGPGNAPAGDRPGGTGLWLQFKNRYPESPREREAIQKEFGI